MFDKFNSLQHLLPEFDVPVTRGSNEVVVCSWDHKMGEIVAMHVRFFIMRWQWKIFQEDLRKGRVKVRFRREEKKGRETCSWASFLRFFNNFSDDFGFFSSSFSSFSWGIRSALLGGNGP
jgi:hypothetical protein